MSYSKIITLSPVAEPPTRFLIAPNPVKGTAQLVFICDHSSKLKLNVRNNIGKIVYEISRPISMGTSYITIPEAQGWPNGFYLITSTIDAQVITQKMIVAH